MFYDNSKELERITELEDQYADAQRALDVEREALSKRCMCEHEWDGDGTLLSRTECFYHAEQTTKLAILQAQLAEIEQILCIESGKTTVDKVRDLHQSFKQVWNSYQSAVNELFDTQAQLRQVEGERDRLKGDMKERFKTIDHLDSDLTTLRQLVEALPVVDVQEVSVWLSPDESGWLVSKRPAFQAGLYWAKFRTQAEADSFRSLLAYRAAQDAGKEDVSHD